MGIRKILLLEPGYRNKYPPLGLMKIASYHGAYGKQDFVKFSKGEDKALYDTGWDRIYITTLFSFEWRATERCIDFAVSLVGGGTNKIFVGGIAASLIHDSFLAEKKWHGIRFIKGLLDDAPAVSLQLDEFDGDFYCDDVTGTPIEEHFPDYSILEDVEYEEKECHASDGRGEGSSATAGRYTYDSRFGLSFFSLALNGTSGHRDANSGRRVGHMQC